MKELIESKKELILDFLKENHFWDEKHILSIAIYGSSLSSFSRLNSDIDLFLMTDWVHSYRMGEIYKNQKFDLSLYSINELYFLLEQYEKERKTYFQSVTSNHILLKDEGNTFLDFKYYVSSLSNSTYKKKITSNQIAFLKKLYQNYLENQYSNQKDYWYFNLLEYFRILYHDAKGYSYINPLKVYDSYQNEEISKFYHLVLPPISFRNLFIMSLEEKNVEKRLEWIKKLMSLLQGKEYPSKGKNKNYYFKNNILLDLVGIENNIERCKEMLEKDHPFGNYAYFLLVRRIYDYYIKIYQEEDEITSIFKKACEEMEKKEKEKYLSLLWNLLNKDYHSSCNHYSLKLKF